LDNPNENYTTVFVEHISPVPIVGNIAVHDTSVTALQTVIIQLRDQGFGEIDTISASADPVSDISIEINNALDRITITSESDETLAPIDLFVDAMRSLVYVNEMSNPRPDTRYVDVTITPGRGVPVDTVMTTINVLLVNDECPMFSTHMFSAEVSETDPPGSFILQFTATDSDSGIHGVITYHIIGGDVNLFDLDQNSGIVTLAQMLDYDDGIIQHQITVEARDTNCSSGPVTLTVNVMNENDEPPEFDRNEVCNITIDEGYYGPITNFSLEDPDNWPTQTFMVAIYDVSPSLQAPVLTVASSPPYALFLNDPGFDFEFAPYYVCHLVNCLGRCEYWDSHCLHFCPRRQ